MISGIFLGNPILVRIFVFYFSGAGYPHGLRGEQPQAQPPSDPYGHQEEHQRGLRGRLISQKSNF